MSVNNKLIGRWGEEQAALYLRKQGYRILAQGYHCRWGEIDLIAADKHFLAFVEVKTRKSAAFAAAMEAVDRHKRQRIIATASFWLSQNKTELQPRFDVIEVYYGDGMEKEPKIRHIPNAFTL